MEMKVYYCNEFEGHYPTGAGAVIVAETKLKARRLLDAELKSRGLPNGSRRPDGSLAEIKELDVKAEGAIVLYDGNY
jgi:hypothetical protein